jgi:hypothetical protein
MWSAGRNQHMQVRHGECCSMSRRAKSSFSPWLRPASYLRRAENVCLPWHGGTPHGEPARTCFHGLTGATWHVSCAAPASATAARLSSPARPSRLPPAHVWRVNHRPRIAQQATSKIARPTGYSSATYRSSGGSPFAASPGPAHTSGSMFQRHGFTARLSSNQIG